MPLLTSLAKVAASIAIVLPLSLALSAKPAFADPKLGVSYLYGSSSFSQGDVWSGKTTALNGRTHDFSKFYESDSPTFNLSTDLFVVNKEWAVHMPTFFDAGYSSDLMKVSPMLSLGLGVTYVDPKWDVSVVATNLVTVGGKISEKPCFDKFDRAFHCGTARAWSDVSPHLPTNYERNKRIAIQATYRF